MATATGGILSVPDAYETLREKGWQRVSPFTLPMLMPNGAGAWISIELGARAAVQTGVSACASGAEAIGHGIKMIRSGQADVVVAGGTEASIYPLSFAAFGVVRAISFRDDEPERVRVRWPQRDPGLHGGLIASCGYLSVSKVVKTSYLPMHPDEYLDVVPDNFRGNSIVVRKRSL